MDNTPIIITGCHRSGTTMFVLMLDSHPQIKTVDEDRFDARKLTDYMEHRDYSPNVAFKLPSEATSFREFGLLPGLKVLWCVRDPRDMILSYHMLGCAFSDSEQPVSGPIFDGGGMSGIGRYLSAVDPACVHPGVAEFHRIRAIPQHLRTRGDSILMGALYWELKNRLPGRYAAEGLPVHVVVYEELIAHPRRVLKKVLDFLELPWHDDVLRHHELHVGTYAGGTLGHRPVDPGNTGKWKTGLSAEEVAVIESYCAQGMEEFGYDRASHIRAIERSRSSFTMAGAWQQISRYISPR